MTNGISQDVLKAAGAGVAGAALLIIANGFKYFVQDGLPHLLRVYPGYEITDLVGVSVYCLGMAVGLAAGCIAIVITRRGITSARSAVILSGVAGIALGVLCFVAQTGYDLAFGPLISGYWYSPLDALVSIAYAGMDVVMMAGLAIAGGVTYAVFVVRPVAVETLIRN